jgi:hypothetical protein
VKPVVGPAVVCGMTIQNSNEAQQLAEQEEKIDISYCKPPSDGFKWRKYGRKTVEGQGNH